jgi:hypothetical protein
MADGELHVFVDADAQENVQRLLIGCSIGSV